MGLSIGWPWFESRQDHIFLPCIYSFLSLLRTLFVRTTYINLSPFCFLGPTPVLKPNVWANENPIVDIGSLELNLGPYDWEAVALPDNHGLLP